ncbi:hypothetical protein BH09ACT3_BH09ACT3_04670 [soil metagenome]
MQRKVLRFAADTPSLYLFVIKRMARYPPEEHSTMSYPEFPTFCVSTRLSQLEGL